MELTLAMPIGVAVSVVDIVGEAEMIENKKATQDPSEDEQERWRKSRGFLVGKGR